MAFHNVPPNGFPDLPDVEELEAVEKDVTALKTATAEQGAAITALGTSKAAKADIAPTFSAESNYAVGDLVYYEGVLYECTTEHEAAAWNVEDFTATSIDGELSAINSNLASLITNYVLTAESNVTIDRYSCVKIGNLVIVDALITATDTIDESSIIVNGLPNIGLNNIAITCFEENYSAYNTKVARIFYDGVIAGESFSAGKYRICATYTLTQ